MSIDSATEPCPAARPFFSICIPAFNRARFLQPLLDSVVEQGFADLEIVVAEDASPERGQIVAICRSFCERHALPLRLHQNASNLGYDGNIRKLVELSRGTYCFFMGNDDLLAPGALTIAAASLRRHPQAGMLLRGYSWFDDTPDQVADTVRYVAQETVLSAGREALTMCYRRSGIISGYVIARDLAFAAATPRFDGTLFYQLHLTACVLLQRPAVVVPDVLVLCRNSEAPEFGHAPAEQGKFEPGAYTVAARVRMVLGALQILDAHPELSRSGIRRSILKDYARHFYPFIRGQLALPLRPYLSMCRAYARTELGRFPSFYVNCLVAYLLGQRSTDTLLHFVRARMGRTPRLS